MAGVNAPLHYKLLSNHSPWRINGAKSSLILKKSTLEKTFEMGVKLHLPASQHSKYTTWAAII